MTAIVACARAKSPPAPSPWTIAEGDELLHVLREPAQSGAEQEEGDRHEVELAAPVDVAELPVERNGDRHREHVAGEHPRVVRQTAEVGDDPREGRGDDRLVEAREQQREHQRPVDGQDAPDREAVSGRLVGETSAERGHWLQTSGEP